MPKLDKRLTELWDVMHEKEEVTLSRKQLLGLAERLRSYSMLYQELLEATWPFYKEASDPEWKYALADATEELTIYIHLKGDVPTNPNCLFSLADMKRLKEAYEKADTAIKIFGGEDV